MKTLKLLSYSIIILTLSLTFNSCSGDEGKQGENGEDGNANVQTIRFQSPQWITSSIVSFKQMYLDIPQITYDDINFSVILHYISFRNQTYALLPVDNHFINGVGSGFSIRANPDNHSTTIRISKTAGGVLPDPTPSVDFLKIIVIKPSNFINTSGNSSARPVSAKQKIQSELQNAGVDINDYYAVCDYYNVNP